MAIKYTEEQLNTIDKSLLVQMFLNQQEQLETLTTQVRSLNEKMQLMMEQLVLSNRNRFGRSSENFGGHKRAGRKSYCCSLFGRYRFVGVLF